MDPASLNSSLARKYLGHYRTVLAKIYETQRPNLKISVQQALGDDEWRYSQLPHNFDVPRKTEGHTIHATASEHIASLSKADLARLVRWKTTHGHSRPFLAGMIAKNSEKEVEECTTAAKLVLAGLKLIASSDTNTDNSESKMDSKTDVNVDTGDDSDKLDASDVDLESCKQVVKRSLVQLTKLHGVGPATASLVLSIFDPQTVPFFEDELYIWLTRSNGPLNAPVQSENIITSKKQVTEKSNSRTKVKTASTKLKYDVKEYEVLLDEAWDVMRRTGLKAWELEKVAYVLEHLDVLGDGGEDVPTVEGTISGVEQSKVSEGGDDFGKQQVETQEEVKGKGSKQSTEGLISATTNCGQVVRQDTHRTRKRKESDDQHQAEKHSPRRSRRLNN